MKKFREYNYCDQNRLNLYINQIDELLKTETSNSYEKTTEVEVGIEVPFVKAGTILNETHTKSYSLNSNLMERFINWACDD